MSLRRLAWVALGLLTVSSATACSSTTEEEETDEGAVLSERNLGGRDFGLQAKELILTLDDGPGARTKELVDFLVRPDVQVPAVFFMVGKNAATPQGRAAMEHIAQMSSRVPGGLIIANHSMTHTDPLPKQGVQGSVSEITRSDAILREFINKSQAQFQGQPMAFFRPPYGAFTALGAANIARVNQGGGSSYVGPVFWEIGGELKNGFSADWACWGRNGVSVQECAAGYIREVESPTKQKGIMLFHDVHSKTIDMLIGTNGARSLILDLKAKGYKFVSMRRDEDRHAQQFAISSATQAASAADIAVNTEVVETSQTRIGRVEVTYDVGRVRGATGAVITFDRDPRAGDRALAKSGTFDDEGQLGPGQHTVAVAAVDASGNILAINRFNVIVPQLVDAEPEGEGNPCTNYHKLKELRADGRTAGRPFKLLHGRKQGCAGDGPECFNYNGTARVAATSDGRTANVSAIGGDEWSIEYDLTYASDSNDRSKLKLILETETGKIVTGKRVRANGTEMATFHQTSTDHCQTGVWRGEFVYKTRDGRVITEEFVFRNPDPRFEPDLYNDR